jgi:predicted DNA-binding protein (MmcQ/YjbR family)
MAKQRTIDVVVRELCLAFPEAEEFTSHGSPNFRTPKGRTFATYLVNHHGDGRIALWLPMPPGAQDEHVRLQPKHFFVPPYVGPSGWLGVNLDTGLDWKRVAALVRTAYERVSPPKLVARIAKTPVVKPPDAKLKAEDMDRMAAPAAQRALAKLRAICRALPEASEGTQFGAPVFLAGKRSFAIAYDYGEGLRLGFWVGVEKQGLYTADPRFTIPKYMGHNGWIAFAPGTKPNWDEVADLARQSYRHFALKRMLKELDGFA